MSGKVKKHLGVHLVGDTAEFRVWAPFASSVAVIGTFSQWEEVAMAAEDGGVWSVTVSGVEPGQSYKYRIAYGDNVFERVDPRARQLTDTKNGASVIIDPDEYAWQSPQFTPAPKNQQVIYELHVGTFHRPDAATPGTFASAIEKLDYLKELGINTIELMPVASMDMELNHGWGYAPFHLYSVETAYGGRHGLLQFVDSCHQRGIGVILDVVYNHLPHYNDLWQFDGWSENNGGGIYFYNDSRDYTPWGQRLDYGRPEVREFILDNVTMWLTEYRIDGLRVDSTLYLRNTNGIDGDTQHDLPDAWSLLGAIVQRVHRINPQALIVAEDSSTNESITQSLNSGGLGFDAQWDLNFPYTLRKSLGLVNEAQSTDDLAGRLAYRYNNDPFHRVVFSDSHDTAANGSARLNEAAGAGHAENVHAREQTILASALSLTAPGIPLLLQGEEFLQEGAFNDWHMLEWQRAEKFHGIVQAHQHLIALRRNMYANTAGLVGGSISVFHNDNEHRVIAYHRWDNGGARDDTIVIANFNPTATASDYSVTFPISGTWRVRFNSSWKGYSPEFREVVVESIVTDEHGVATVALAPYGVLILSRD